MKTPEILALNVDGLPHELRELPVWVGWRWAFRKGRWTKEPINVRNGRLAKTDDPSTQASLVAALSWLSQAFKCDGVGVCRPPGFVFCDLDGVLDESGKLRTYAWAVRTVEQLRGRGYWAKSLSGCGLHGIVKGTLPPGRRQFEMPPPPGHTGLALYDGPRFLALSGHVYDGSGPIGADCTEQLARIHAQVFPEKLLTASVRAASAALPHLADDELLEKARHAKNGGLFSALFDRGEISGYPSHSEADQALANLLAYWTGNDPSRMADLFSRSALNREKWAREDYRNRTIAAAVKVTRTVYQPRNGKASVGAQPRNGKASVDGPLRPVIQAASSTVVDSGAPGASNFRIADDGVYFQAAGSDRKPLRICGRLEVVAITRDAAGTGWGWLLRWTDREARVHEWPMPASSLAGDLIEVRSRLLDGGLTISSARGVGGLLSEYIQTAVVEARLLCVSRLGWHGSSFVLTDETIGPGGAERVLFQTQHESENYFNVSGSIEEWRENVGRLCIGNSRLVLAVSAAFAGPILSIMGAESGGIHFVGVTSSGKTTALQTCGSVLGGGGRQGFCQTWNATANGLEATAALHNDLCLPLDEMSQVLPEEAAEIAYLLANGTGKARMTRYVSSRKKLVWTLLFVSAGELTLADHVRAIGKQIRGGAEVRLLNIDADAGAGMGVFEDIHGTGSPDAFSRRLKEAAKTYYGSPLRAFLRMLTSDRAAAEQSLRYGRQAFLKDNLPADACGEVSRAAARFALIGGAGELASQYGLTGWEDGEATRAAGRCFRDWCVARGTAGGSDVELAIRDVRRFIERHGASRFQVIRYPVGSEESGRDENQVVKDRAGFRRRAESGETEYLILPEVFRAEVCRGHNARLVAQALIERGYLESQPPSHMRKVRLPELGVRWVYSIRAAILE